MIIVARESGTLQRYNFPQLQLTSRLTMGHRPQSMSLNCNASRLSIIDIHGVLALVALTPESAVTAALESNASEDAGKNDCVLQVCHNVFVPFCFPKGTLRTSFGKQIVFERKDVWDVRWASDNPELFAAMEKTRMYIFRDTDPEVHSRETDRE